MLRDLRIALRTLASWRLGAVAAVLTLAVSIGTATTLYALLRAALADSAPAIDDVKSVGRIYGANPLNGTGRMPIALADFTASLAHAQSFESVAAWMGTEMPLGAGADGETLSVTQVSESYFAVLRARPAAGRLFTGADFEASNPVALISEAVWRRHLAARPIEAGLTITLNGLERRVVGVVPAAYEFSFISIGGDAWVPLTADGSGTSDTVSVIARLDAQHTWTSAAAELSTLTPPSQRELGRWTAIPIEQDTRTRGINAAAGTLLPALVVLVIGCVNVACMLLARGIHRDTELSVRAALGATRGAIFRQLLMENMLLAAAGGILGAALAAAALQFITSRLIALKPFLAARLGGDLGLLPIALASSVVACVLFGAIPAIRLSRRDIASSLKGVTSARRVRIAGYGGRDLIVFFELGVAVVLVVVTAMWFSLFGKMQSVTSAFAADEVVAVRIPATDVGAAVERVRPVPGVDSVSVASHPPGGTRGFGGRARADNGRDMTIALLGAGDGFFDTVGLPIIRGRAFDRTEIAESGVAVVAQSAAAALWPGEDALGRQIDVTTGGGSVRLVVIGVARDALDLGLWFAPPAVYRPLNATASRELVLLVRSSRAHDVLRPVASAVRSSPSGRMPTPRVLGDRIGLVPPESLEIIRTFGAFALIALLLAASGIFGVMSQSVTQRTTEFGVRMALGATPGRVLRMVVTREGKLIAAAIASGAVGTIAVTRSVFAELVLVSSMNPAWPVALTALCGAIAAVACALATYRIVKLEPSQVLRRS